MQFLNDMAVPFASAVIGGLISFILAKWSAKRSETEERYAHADAQYATVLQLYLANPEFSDERATRDFKRAFADGQALRYGAFASLVHNFLETIFDYYHAPSGAIDSRWEKIFAHHARMHAPWLKENGDKYEAGYVDYIADNFDGEAVSPRPR